MHARTLVVARLLGNTCFCPAPVAGSSSLGGFPAALLRACAVNAEVRLRILEAVEPDQRPLLNERALSSDVVELVFSVVHSRLGAHFDMPTLVGSLTTVAFVAGLAAKPEEKRGWRMAPTSKSYACHSEEGNERAWNDGTALPGGARAGHHHRMHVARAVRKAGATTLGGGQRQKHHAHMA